MTTRHYLITMLAVTALWVAALLTVPPFARLVEQLMLWFLSTNAG
jgi:hypothetical protein